MTQYLLGDLKLRLDGSNPSVGGGALIPRERSLKEGQGCAFTTDGTADGEHKKRHVAEKCNDSLRP